MASLGFVNVFKPAQMTSHDVVARLRKIIGVKQIGHAGTLDPMATGVLPIGVGSACRLIRFLSSGKIYLAEFLLGTTTATDDIEGDILAKTALPNLSMGDIENSLQSFVGKQMQTPPAYSAIRYGGKHLYELARAGKTPTELAGRPIIIDSIDLLAAELPIIKVRIKCSSGTYIRSIARDFGDKLGCGACLQLLLREKSGPFLEGSAFSLDKLAELAGQGRLGEAIIAPEDILEIAIVDIDKQSAKSLMMGQYLSVTSLPPNSLRGGSDDKLCLVKCDESLVALCEVTDDNRLHAEVVLGNAKSFV